MFSSFITAAMGTVRLLDGVPAHRRPVPEPLPNARYQYVEGSSSLLIQIGGDNYFRNDIFLSQVRYANAIIRANFPPILKSGKVYQVHPVFMFDHSPVHKTTSEKWPNTAHIIRSDGGKNQPKYPPQLVTTEAGLQTTLRFFNPMTGVTYGLDTIAQQLKVLFPTRCRRLDFATVSTLRRSLSANFPSIFKNETRLDDLAKSLNVTVLWLPKFHCDLNGIEFFWAYVKSKLRRSSEVKGDSGLAAFRRRCAKVVESVPLHTICRMLRHVVEVEMVYLGGASDSHEATRAVKRRRNQVNKSHGVQPGSYLFTKVPGREETERNDEFEKEFKRQVTSLVADVEQAMRNSQAEHEKRLRALAPLGFRRY
ncbi:MAG: hypothetical protein MHM6MM_001320 [Cercozoa sp. M6MM]